MVAKKRGQKGKSKDLQHNLNATCATLCSKSLDETIKNFNVNKNTISGDLQLSLKEKELFSGSFVLKPEKRVKRNTWVISYKSSESFNTNKNETPQTNLLSLFGALTKQPFQQFSMQIRGFKTDRSFDAEMKRNPNMTSRLKDAFGKMK